MSTEFDQSTEPDSRPAIAAEPATEPATLADGPGSMDQPERADVADDATLSELLARGGELATAERFDEAMSYFGQALAIDPDSADALYGLAFTQRKTDAGVKAHTTLTSALERFPDNPTLLTEMGVLLSGEGDYDQAIVVLDRSLASEPSIKALIWRSAALRALGRPEESEATVRPFIDDPPTMDDVALLVELGWALGDQQRHDEALSAFEAALEWEPDNIDALRWRATELRYLERFEDAEAAVRSALSIQPENAGLYVELGWVLDASQRHEEALEAFRSALVTEPDNPDALRWQATELRFLGRLDEAEAVVRTCISGNSDSAALHIELGWVKAAKSADDEALAEFEAALALEPTNLDALRWRTTELAALNRTADAEASARAAIDALPEAPELQLDLGWFLTLQDRQPEALAAFDSALVNDPDNLDAAVAKAALLRGMREPIEAEAAARTGLDAHPESVELADTLGWALIDQGRLDEARRSFDDLVESSGDADVSLAGRGAIVFLADDYMDAEVLFRRAVVSGDESASSLTNLAWSIVQGSGRSDLSRFDEAGQLCRRALDADPGYGSAYSCLAMMAFRSDDRRASEKWYLKMIEVDPDGASYADLGALYNTQGRFDEAEVQLKKAIAMDWHDSQAHVEMGNLNILQDHHAEGAACYRQALEIRPTDMRATRGLAGALANCGQMVDAERVLQGGLGVAGDEDRWQIHVLLGRILLRRAADTGDGLFYRQALGQAQQAIIIKPEDGGPRWLAAQAHWGIAAESKDPSRSSRRHARHNAEECLKRDPSNYEAMLLIERAGDQLKDTRTLLLGQVAICGVSLALLMVTWLAFLVSDDLSEGAVLALTPLLAGLVVVGVLLPLLTGLKVGGLEAQFRQIQEAVLDGPQGNPLTADTTLSNSTLEPNPAATAKGSKRADTTDAAKV